MSAFAVIETASNAVGRENRMRRAPLHPFSGIGWALVQLGFALAMTLGHWADYRNPWMVVLAAVLSAGVAGIPLSARWSRTRPGHVVMLGWLGIMALVGTQIPAPVVGELSVMWPATSATMAMGLMAMLGLWRWAYGITAAVLVQGFAWGVSRGLTLADGLEQVSILTSLLAGTVYRLMMRRARQREITARQEESAALEQLGTLASRAEARREYRTRVLNQIGGLLDRIEAGQELSLTDRTECRLVEAGLRDAIRGRGLATRDIEAAARSARERGATVTLIDDRRIDCSDAVCRSVLTAVVETLERAGAGDTFVARLLPVGRRNVATVLLTNEEGGGVRREFAPPESGDPADRAVERAPITLSG